jgi:signal transduction histidine kinase
VTTKPEGRGTGLGLTITRDVIARLGGSLDVASEPGRGTTFTITLPVDSGGMSDNADTADR